MAILKGGGYKNAKQFEIISYGCLDILDLSFIHYFDYRTARS